MLQSMTAYGRHHLQTEGGDFLWELRSVNHRYLELALRLPEQLRFIEPQVRSTLSARLKRGKVDAVLRFSSSSRLSTSLVINQDLAQSVMAGAESIYEGLAHASAIDPMTILAWPGVVSESKVEETELHGRAMESLGLALEDYLAARSREGGKIIDMLEDRCRSISEIVSQLRHHRPSVIQRQQDKLRQRIADLGTETEPHRLEQELLFYAQKLDVDEELDRLDAHLSEMRNVFSRKEPVGRRLDFLMQEFNREANTLGSKSGDADTTALVVDLKVLIEQMREQIQNLE